MTGGMFKYVSHKDVYAHFERGWCIAATLGRYHGCFSVLMWHCECGQVQP
jgi:hypothetical protein